MGAPPVVRGIRATLPACGTTLAGVEHLRPADPGTDRQFHPYAEYQFPENHGRPPLFWGGEIVSVPVGVPNPWGILSQSVCSYCLSFRGCHNYRVAPRRSAARLDHRRQYDLRRDLCVARAAGDLGVLEVPFFLTFAYTAIVAAMGYELSNDMARAAQLARELEVSDKKLNLAADSADLSLWEWDLNKDEIWITPTRRAQLGWPVSRKITFEDVISRWHADDRDQVRQAIEDAIKNGKDYETEFRIVRADGNVRWMAARGRAHVNKKGKPTRLLGVTMDVTARKQAELEAQQQRDELEQLRQQRTALLEREVAERTRLEREVIDICAREQRRIAYDLHDSVGQQLVGIALCAKLLEEQLRGERHSEADKAGTLSSLLMMQPGRRGLLRALSKGPTASEI